MFYFLNGKPDQHFNDSFGGYLKSIGGGISGICISMFTLLGATIWCSVLCWLGVTIGADITKGEMHKVIFMVGGTAVVLGGLYYFFVHRHLDKKSEAGSQKPE